MSELTQKHLDGQFDKMAIMIAKGFENTATKADIKNLATKDDLKREATEIRQDLEDLERHSFRGSTRT